MNAFDSAIIVLFNRIAQQNCVFDRAIDYLGDYSLMKGGIFATVLWWIWFRSEDVDDKLREQIITTIFASFVAIVLARGLALALPFRPRPYCNPDLLFRLPCGAKTTDLETWSAFPSDHATMFFAFSTGLLYVSRSLGIAALIYTFIVICLPRIYLGQHHPTDIIIGGLLGAATAWIVHKSGMSGYVTQPAQRWQKRHPSSFYACSFLVTYQIADLFSGIRAPARALVHTIRYFWKQ